MEVKLFPFLTADIKREFSEKNLVKEIEYLRKNTIILLEENPLKPGIILFFEKCVVMLYFDSIISLDRVEIMKQIKNTFNEVIELDQVQAIDLLVDNEFFSKDKRILISVKYKGKSQQNNLYIRDSNGKIIDKGAIEDNFGFDLGMLLE